MNTAIKLALAVTFGFVTFFMLNRKKEETGTQTAVSAPSAASALVAKNGDALKVGDAPPIVREKIATYEVLNAKPFPTEPTICCVGRVDEFSGTGKNGEFVIQ